MTARNEDFEEFKLKLNSTMTTLQNSVSELESQLGNIKDETTTDVEEIVEYPLDKLSSQACICPNICASSFSTVTS